MALEAKKTLIMRIYQILDEYSDEEHPLTQQRIIDILERDYDIVCERKAIGRNISYLKEMGFDLEFTLREERTLSISKRNSAFSNLREARNVPFAPDSRSKPLAETYPT